VPLLLKTRQPPPFPGTSGSPEPYPPIKIWGSRWSPSPSALGCCSLRRNQTRGRHFVQSTLHLGHVVSPNESIRLWTTRLGMQSVMRSWRMCFRNGVRSGGPSRKVTCWLLLYVCGVFSGRVRSYSPFCRIRLQGNRKFWNCGHFNWGREFSSLSGSPGTFLIYVAACRHEFVWIPFVWFSSEVPASKCMDPASYPQRENDKVSDALDSIDESERVFTMNAFEGAKGFTVLNGITGWGSSGRPKDAHRLGDSRRVRELDPELSRNFRCGPANPKREEIAEVPRWVRARIAPRSRKM
jgi:hypothetical protein